MIGPILALFLSVVVFGTLGYFIGHDRGREKGRENDQIIPWVPTSPYLTVDDNQKRIHADYQEDEAIRKAKNHSKRDINKKFHIYKKICTVEADIPVSVNKVK